MILDNLMPVFALIVAGVILRRTGLTNDQFLRTGDRLIYYVFFPALLFGKIGGTPITAALPVSLWLAGGGALFVSFVLSLVAIAVLRIRPYQAGAFSQATYRFNTFVAIAVVGTARGDAGVQRLGELLSLVIPMANVLAVATLIWFSPRQLPHRERARLTLSGLVTNPLILACIAGMIWARFLPPMPAAMATTLRLAASITLPLALLSVGGALTLKAVRGHAALASVATILKCAILPLVGYVLLRTLGIEGDDRLIAMLFFAMPASTAMYVLATQLDSDASLASAIIVTSTIASFVSLSAVLLIFG